jgi:reactive intermediate/imine deaminase
MRFVTVFLLLGIAASGADFKPVTPPGVKPIGPYTPGILAGGFLYVSGQGARDAANHLPESAEDQVHQCLENVRNIVSAAGLSMEHIVSAQVYLTDMKDYAALDRVWSKYFPKDPPARTVIGISRIPAENPVEITVVAVKDLSRKKSIYPKGKDLPEPISPAIVAEDRVFLTGGLGRDASGKVPPEPRQQMKLVMDSAEQVLRLSGLDLRNLIYVNIYIDPGMPLKLLADVIDEFIPDETARTIIQTNSLPFGVHLQISGIAAKNVERVGGHCTAVSEAVYCSGRFGTVRQALASLKADLRVSKIDLNRAVAAHAYLDDMDEFAAFNKVYAGFFGKIPPTRTTVQPWKKIAELSLPPTTGVSSQDDASPRAQVSVIAIR